MNSVKISKLPHGYELHQVEYKNLSDQKTLSTEFHSGEHDELDNSRKEAKKKVKVKIVERGEDIEELNHEAKTFETTD